MTGSPLAIAVFAAAALLSIALLLVPKATSKTYLSDREAHATHAVMNGVMAAMVLPHGSSDSRIWLAILGVTSLVLAVRFVANARRGDGSAPGSAYHLLAALAMIAAIRWMPDHHEMAMGHTMTGGGGWIATLIALVFALDAILTAVLGFALPGKLVAMSRAISGDPIEYDGATLCSIRLSSVTHIVMDVGMVAMLV